MNDFTYIKDPDFKEGRYYIGASDIPVLAGLYKHYGETPYSLWEKKTGRANPFEGNERTKAGKELEPIVLKWGLEKLDNLDSEEGNKFLIAYHQMKKNHGPLHFKTESKHIDRPYLVAHADLLHIGHHLIEAKTTGFFGAKRGDDINKGYDKEDMTANGIPAAVYLQIQTQMLCYDIPISYVSVMIDTGQHRLYGPISAHKKTQEKILALAERFWWHVEKDKSPKPETWADINKMFPKLIGDSKTVISGPELEKVIEMKERAKKIRAKEKENKNELEDIKNAIGLIIGENAFLESSSGDSLAKATLSTRYFLKNHQGLTKARKTKLIKDGFITETESRTLRF